jgi:hypothetical protein
MTKTDHKCLRAFEAFAFGDGIQPQPKWFVIGGDKGRGGQAMFLTPVPQKDIPALATAASTTGGTF